jgi:putative transposase
MPRLARLDAPGVLHHIMFRGIERRKIFLDAKDREDMIDRLEKLLPETQTGCYAWVFIPNHAHFLFRTGIVPIATFMRRLLTGYAVSFNRRHNRVGQLFQNRYKSIVCQEDAYLKELVRYIHLNPIRSGLVSGLEELNRFPYCGHSALMGVKKVPWQEVEHVLGSFGGTVRNARKSYLSYMEAGVGQGRRDDLSGGGLIRSLGGWSEAKKIGVEGNAHVMSDERILGESEFVAEILSQAGEAYERKYALKGKGFDLDRIAERVAEIMGMAKEEVFSGGRQQKTSKARSLLCFWAVRELGLSLRELSRRLGLSGPGVGYAVERGEVIARQNGYKLLN